MSIGTPLVSVLMTAFNRESFIAEAIESVLSSTYVNFELIIVDDCSVDNTVVIAKKYAANDSRIRVFCNNTNLGQFANRNKAASYARGVYLKYVDSDDIIYPHTLQVMVDGMLQFPDAAFGFCLTTGAGINSTPYQIESKTAIMQHYLGGGLLFVCPTGYILRKTEFDNVNGFEEFGMPSDNHLSLKMAAKYPVVAMRKDLFWWRNHPGQVFTQNKNNYYNILNNYNYSRDIINNYSPLTKRENNRILYNLKKIFFSHLLRLAFKKHRPWLALSLFFKSKK